MKTPKTLSSKACLAVVTQNYKSEIEEAVAAIEGLQRELKEIESDSKASLHEKISWTADCHEHLEMYYGILERLLNPKSVDKIAA